MRAVFLVGVPGCGKSALVRETLPLLGQKGEHFEYGLFFGETYPAYNTLILGSYDSKETFPGTDRLSMAIQKDAKNFFLHLNEKWKDWTVFGEGGRISTGAFWQIAHESTACRGIFLLVSPDEGIKRREARSYQNEQWVKGRITQLENLYKKYQTLFPCERWENETKSQMKVNVQRLFQELR